MRPKIDAKLQRPSRVRGGLRTALLAAAVLVVAAVPHQASAAAGRTFETPEQAVEGLIAAVRKGDTRDILAILGPQARSLVSSGDPVADRALGERFVRDYDMAHSLKAGGKIVPEGPQASGGAYAYVANGRMLGGFVLVTFPAQYGVSGVETFVVNHDGVVYEKDLGPRTGTLARQIKAFDPDSTWRKVPAE